MADETFEVEFKTTGQDPAVRAFEALKLKELEAKQTTSALGTELRNLQRSGTATAQEIENVSRSMIRAQAAAANYGRQAAQLQQTQIASATATTAVTTRFEALGGVIGQVGAVVGRLSPELAGVGQTITVVGSSVTALSGALGPVAAAIAVVTIAAQAMNVAMDESDDRINDVAGAAESARQRVASLGADMAAQARMRRLEAGVGTAAETLRAQQEANQTAEAAIAIQRRLRQEERLAWSQAMNARGDERAAAIQRQRDARTQINTTRELARTETERARRLDQAHARAVHRESAEQSQRIRHAQQLREAEEAERRRAAAARAGAAARRQAEAAERADLERRFAEQTAYSAGLKRMRYEEAEAQRAATEETARQHEAVQRRLLEIDVAAIERLRSEQRAAAQEREAEQEREAARAREVAKANADFAEGLVGGVQGTFNNLVGQTIGFLQEGGDLASETYLAMLDSFLESTAVEYSIRALAEVGQAIAAFARQDHVAGPQHIAAAAVYGAVAVATGAAGAAISVPSAAQAQAQPQQVQQSTPLSNGTGQNNTINLYAPNAVMTEAERGEIISNGLRALRRERGPGASRI